MTEKQSNDKPAKSGKAYWLDRPENVTRIITVLIVVSIALGLVDFLYHKHAYFSWEELPNFYGFFGLISCLVLVLLAKVLRFFVIRDEEYYDE